MRAAEERPPGAGCPSCPEGARRPNNATIRASPQNRKALNRATKIRQSQPLLLVPRLRGMADQPTLDKELSTPAGRRLWQISLGVTGLLAVIGIIFLVLAKHYAWLP